MIVLGLLDLLVILGSNVESKPKPEFLKGKFVNFKSLMLAEGLNSIEVFAD